MSGILIASAAASGSQSSASDIDIGAVDKAPCAVAASADASAAAAEPRAFVDASAPPPTLCVCTGETDGAAPVVVALTVAVTRRARGTRGILARAMQTRRCGCTGVSSNERGSHGTGSSGADASNHVIDDDALPASKRGFCVDLTSPPDTSLREELTNVTPSMRKMLTAAGARREGVNRASSFSFPVES